METLIAEINWLPTLLAAVLAFLLGWAWYSPFMFLEGWQTGIGQPVWQAPMWMPMLAQFGSSVLLSIIIGLSIADGHVGHAILVVMAIAGFVKASGFYSGKTKYAVLVEVGYIITMAALMIGVHLFI